MTKPTNSFFQPWPESGQGLHTQESGNAGLSSNMKHVFIDHYIESALPVAEKGSFVKPIPKEERDTVDSPCSHTPVFEYAAGPKTHSVFAEEHFTKPPTCIVAQNIYFPPQVKSDNNPDDEAVKILTGKATITEEQPEVEGNESCTKMDAWEIPEKPKGPLLVSKINHRKKRVAGMSWKELLACGIVFVLFAVSGGSPVPDTGAPSSTDCKCRDIYPSAAKCYTCKDNDGCKTLNAIYNSSYPHYPIYTRHVNQIFPICSEISPPGDKCTVCLNQSTIIIFCSMNIEEIDLVESTGFHIGTFPLKCEKQQTPGPTSQLPNVPNPNLSEPNVSRNTTVNSRTHPGLIFSCVLFVIMLVALGISCCCKKRGRSIKYQTISNLSTIIPKIEEVQSGLGIFFTQRIHI
ncbi:uncharacterized protein LOC134862348 isoform X1 [Eleginops maclovinus]|uniref:uncharacterized protein LOC134862348 isoform X1 n=1 Tax=Eleginops maclovinus TaxID=56733 RepID=UPI003080FEA0